MLIPEYGNAESGGNTSSRSILGSGAIFFAFSVYLGSFVFEGVLRYGCATAGVPNLLYFRDALALFIICYLLLVNLFTRNWIDGFVFNLLMLTGVHFIQALFFEESLFQALFGAKMFLSLILGVAMWPVINQKEQTLLYLTILFFLASVLGVFINYVVGTLPWEAFEYQTAFGNVATTKEWWTAGTVRRLPGFARGSAHAAAIIGVTGVLVLAHSRSFLLRGLILVLGSIAILLTTSKGMLLAFALVGGWLLIAKESVKFGLAILVFFFVLAIVLPILSILVHFGDPSSIPYLFSSFWDRLAWMWPGAFQMLDSPQAVIFGKGLGAIGVPQMYGDSKYFLNAADNIFVYLYINFGLLAIAYLLFPVVAAFRLGSLPINWRVGFVAILGVTIGYGVTTNMIEQPFVMTILGAIYAMGFQAICSHRASVNVGGWQTVSHSH